MPNYQFPSQISDLLQRHLSSAQYRDEDEVLLAALHSLTTEEQEWQAVNAALTTLEQGAPGVSLDEAFAVVRRRHQVVTAE